MYLFSFFSIFLRVSLYMSRVQYKMVNTQVFIYILMEKNSNKIKGHIDLNIFSGSETGLANKLLDKVT